MLNKEENKKTKKKEELESVLTMEDDAESVSDADTDKLRKELYDRCKLSKNERLHMELLLDHILLDENELLEGSLKDQAIELDINFKVPRSICSEDLYGIDADYKLHKYKLRPINILFYMASVEAVKTLCQYTKKPLNLTVTDDRGDTLLIHHAKKGHTEIVKYLVELGANILATNPQSLTAEIAASVAHHDNLAKYLATLKREMKEKKLDRPAVLKSAGASTDFRPEPKSSDGSTFVWHDFDSLNNTNYWEGSSLPQGLPSETSSANESSSSHADQEGLPKPLTKNKRKRVQEEKKSGPTFSRQDIHFFVGKIEHLAKKFPADADILLQLLKEPIEEPLQSLKKKHRTLFFTVPRNLGAFFKKYQGSSVLVLNDFFDQLEKHTKDLSSTQLVKNPHCAKIIAWLHYSELYLTLEKNIEIPDKFIQSLRDYQINYLLGELIQHRDKIERLGGTIGERNIFKPDSKEVKALMHRQWELEHQEPRFISALNDFIENIELNELRINQIIKVLNKVSTCPDLIEVYSKLDRASPHQHFEINKRMMDYFKPGEISSIKVLGRIAKNGRDSSVFGFVNIIDYLKNLLTNPSGIYADVISVAIGTISKLARSVDAHQRSEIIAILKKYLYLNFEDNDQIPVKAMNALGKLTPYLDPVLRSAIFMRAKDALKEEDSRDKALYTIAYLATDTNQDQLLEIKGILNEYLLKETVEEGFSAFEALCELAKGHPALRTEITKNLIKFLNEYEQDSKLKSSRPAWVCNVGWIKALGELGRCVHSDLRNQIIEGLREVAIGKVDNGRDCRLAAADYIGKLALTNKMPRTVIIFLLNNRKKLDDSADYRSTHPFVASLISLVNNPTLSDGRSALIIRIAAVFDDNPLQKMLFIYGAQSQLRNSKKSEFIKRAEEILNENLPLMVGEIVTSYLR